MKLKIEKKEYINKTFRFTDKLIDKMQKVCDEKGISLNKLTEECLEYALNNLDDSSDDSEEISTSEY